MDHQTGHITSPPDCGREKITDKDQHERLHYFQARQASADTERADVEVVTPAPKSQICHDRSMMDECSSENFGQMKDGAGNDGDNDIPGNHIKGTTASTTPERNCLGDSHSSPSHVDSKRDKSLPEDFSKMILSTHCEADVEGGESSQGSSDTYFSLKNSDSSFVISPTQDISQNAASVSGSYTSCSAKPLSSNAPEVSGLSEMERSSISDRQGGVSQEETKQYETSVQYNLPSGAGLPKEVPQRAEVETGVEDESRGTNRDMEGGQRSHSIQPKCPKVDYHSLVSKEDTSSMKSYEADDEQADILILHHPDDEKFLSQFEDICQRQNWNTITKDEFPIGELYFDQLEEEAKKCTLVVALITSNFLKDGISNHDQQSALFSSIQNKAQNFIPVVYERELKLPSYLKVLNLGCGYRESNLERRLKKTMIKAKKRDETKVPNLPMNHLGSNEQNAQENQQASANSALTKSVPEVFRQMQGNLSPGLYAQRFFSDTRFRELCLILDLTDVTDWPYWHKLAESFGLNMQDILWLDRQGRHAANVLELYFFRNSEEPVTKVLSELKTLLETLEYLQAAGIIGEELKALQRTNVFSSRHCTE